MMRLSLFLLLASVLLLGCGIDKPPSMVASVGAYRLTPQEIGDTTDPGAYVRNWIEEHLLALEAENRKLDREDAYKRLLENLEVQVLAEYLLNKETEKIPAPTSVEIENYYLEHEGEFKRTQLELELLYFSGLDKSNLETIWNSLRHGENPEALAAKHPGLRFGREFVTDPVSKHEPYPSMVHNSEGTVLAPMQFEDRYYVFQIEEKNESGSLLPLARVKEQITVRIGEDRLQEMREKLIKNLRQKYNPTINLELMKAAGITSGDDQ